MITFIAILNISVPPQELLYVELVITTLLVMSDIARDLPYQVEL